MNTLIVTGGNTNLDFLNNLINKEKFDTIIASDKGLEVLDKLEIVPNYIIGDFDSIDNKVLSRYIDRKDINVIKLNPIKDFTDTHMALKLAIDIKSTNISIVGAIGTRIDHVLGNILNENNEISLINKNTILKKDDSFPFISLIPLTTKVYGVTLKGFKYNLEDAAMGIGNSLGISNEQIEDETEIIIKEGIMIIIKSKD